MNVFVQVWDETIWSFMTPFHFYSSKETILYLKCSGESFHSDFGAKRCAVL